MGKVCVCLTFPEAQKLNENLSLQNLFESTFDSSFIQLDS